MKKRRSIGFMFLATVAIVGGVGFLTSKLTSSIDGGDRVNVNDLRGAAKAAYYRGDR